MGARSAPRPRGLPTLTLNLTYVQVSSQHAAATLPCEQPAVAAVGALSAPGRRGGRTAHHLVALHLSPRSVGQLACRLWKSLDRSGVRLWNMSASPRLGAMATPRCAHGLGCAGRSQSYRGPAGSRPSACAPRAAAHAPAAARRFQHAAARRIANNGCVSSKAPRCPSRQAASRCQLISARARPRTLPEQARSRSHPHNTQTFTATVACTGVDMRCAARPQLPCCAKQSGHTPILP